MNKNPFLNGITDLVILSLLSKHDSYMYEIVKHVSEFSEGLIAISQNTIYTAAYKLENEGKISEYSKLVGKKRTRVYYHLENSGKEYLEELNKNYQNTINGIGNIFANLEKIQVTAEVCVSERAEVENEQNRQEICVRDTDFVPDQNPFGAPLSKKACFGY